MAKRVRTLETLGSLPYSTIEGGKWLKKALDPADLDVEIAGLPDSTTNPRCVLNYQFQGDIPIPHSTTYVPTSTQSYDVDFYVFQNPVTLGMSASRPSGLKNPINVPLNFSFTEDGYPTLRFPSGYVPATVQVFENPQIEGTTKNEKLSNLEKYCQRHRMIYGGVQCIPACSALFDSGTIEATQQIFSPQRKNINDLQILTQQDTTNNPPPMANPSTSYQTDNKVHFCQRFEENDFPDEGSSIQNSTALYCRYREGLYMPYKMRNPLVYDYIGSEQRVLTEAPYIVSDEIYFVGATSANSTTTWHVETGIYDAATNSCSCPVSGWLSTFYIFFKCYTKTGIPFYIQITQPSSALPFSLPPVVPAYNSKIGHFHLTDGQTQTDINFRGANFKLTELDILGKDESVYDIPVGEANIGIICFRSIGLQASIRVIFRFGLEMMITAGGVYSPFKHKAPKFDQKALNSYIRATHNMRDAFLGNAATPEGHALFAAHVAAIAAADENGFVSNQGSRWYGAVSV